MERVAEVPPEALAPVDFPTARAQFVRDTAAKYGIAPAEIEATLAKAQFLDSVVAAMSRPAERVKPWSEYRVGFLTQARIDRATAELEAQAEAEGDTLFPIDGAVS